MPDNGAFQPGPRETLARRTLESEWCGRAPVYDIICNDAVLSHYGGETLTLENASEVVPRALGRALDATRLAMSLPRAPGRQQLPDGSVYQHSRWTSWLVRGPITSYEAYRANLRRSAQALLSEWSEADQAALAALLTTYLETKFLLGDILLLGNFGTKAGFMALFSPNYLEYMGYALADEPQLVALVLEANTHKSVQRVQHLPANLAGLCPAVFIGEDMAYKTGPMTSPAFLRQQYWPRFRRIVDAYHQRGIKVIFHSDGNLWPVLDDLVATGIDGLNPLEVAAGMDPVLLRQRYPRLLLFGGISYSTLLVSACPEEIAQVTRATIEKASPGYFVGSDTELGNDVPLANAIAMIETARTYRS